MKIRGNIGASEAPVDLFVEDGRIIDIRPADLSQASDCGDEHARITPGFIDLQLNGYDGVDFNDADTRPEQMVAATRQLWRTGVTAFCPTIITGSNEHISRCISNVIRATGESPEFARAMLGIHVEGPFISTEDGPRGAHPREHARKPDWEEFQRWQDTARGRIRIITLSPEWPESSAFIERAAESGVIVAIGHTAASPSQIADAIRAGATMSTHLGNGSHAKIDRHPNYIWEQLAADELWASFIVDGHHLPPSVVKCFLRAKGVSRGILVTDAIAAAGKPSGRHKLGNVEVEVTAERRVCLPGTPYLAGSVLEMHEAVAKTVRYSDATLDDALRMASGNPAQLLGVADRLGTIEIGRQADLVLFRWEEELEVEAAIIGGEFAFKRAVDAAD
jgi:N-acetylglucosamine-6-phosphate deacetylase